MKPLEGVHVPIVTMKVFGLGVVVLAGGLAGLAQTPKKDAAAAAKKPLSAVVADVSDADLNGTSAVAQGLLLDGLIAQWHATADASNYKLVKEVVDKHIGADGMLDVHGAEAAPLARTVLTLYRVTLDAKYFKLAQEMEDALLPQVVAGDAISAEESYAVLPFVAAYAATVNEEKGLDAVAEKLLTHGPAKGMAQGVAQSHAMRADAAAWRAATLVDVLEWVPESYGKRAALLEALVKVAPRAVKTEPAEGAGQQMGAYAVLKGVRRGWLPQSMESAAAEVRTAGAKQAQSARDTSPHTSNTSAGAEKLLQSEMQQSATEGMAQNTLVAVDGWFNSQQRKNGLGMPELFHYKWKDDANSGFAFFGRAFQRYGARLEVVGRPSAESLKGAGVYLIVSPDIPSKNPHPNYVEPADVEAVARWVNDGGVLLLMQNDGPNAEFEHFNTLSERFGIHFNPVLKNHVEGDHWEQGKIVIPAGVTTVFRDAHTAYMKDTCTIATQPPAVPVLRDVLHGSGDVYMAIAAYGKGKVYAVVDPWFYNEYTDGQKLPAEYDQFAAAKELARWALEQAK